MFRLLLATVPAIYVGWDFWNSLHQGNSRGIEVAEAIAILLVVLLTFVITASLILPWHEGRLYFFSRPPE